MPPESTDNQGLRNPFAKLVNRLPILSPLLKRDFRLLWFGEGISLLGSQFHFIALSWLTLQITGSGLALGTVLMVGTIPRALLMLFGGALSDSYSPRRIMIVSNLSRAVVVGVIALIVFYDVVELWHLYLLSILFGVVDSFFHPAFNAIIPRIVEKDKLEAGNAILRGTHELSFLIGSAPAGLLISAVGMDLAFGIDSVSFILAAVCLKMMTGFRGKAPLSADEFHLSKRPVKLANILSDVKEGVRYALGKPALRAFILAIAVIDFSFSGPLDVGLAWLSEHRFVGGATAFGTILSSFGGGALLGTIIAGVCKFKRRGLWLATLGVILGTGLGLYGVVPNVTGAAILSVFMGVGVGIFNIMLISWFQKEAPSRMLGRIMSLVTFASVGLMPVSFAVSGMLVDVHAPLLFAVAGGVTLAACIYLFSVRAVRAID
ncbi:MAG: MFS transporter [Dehalococcoidaceae bacterium]|nr:MFS transporter [Dehalococcoidaceae bacterium]